MIPQAVRIGRRGIRFRQRDAKSTTLSTLNLNSATIKSFGTRTNSTFGVGAAWPSDQWAFCLAGRLSFAMACGKRPPRGSPTSWRNNVSRRLRHVIPSTHVVRADEPIGRGARAISDRRATFQFIGAPLKTSKTRRIEFLVRDEFIGASATRSFQDETAIGIDRACLESHELLLHFCIHFIARLEFRSEDVVVTPAHERGDDQYKQAPPSC
jgi:hypothetical protein